MGVDNHTLKKETEKKDLLGEDKFSLKNVIQQVPLISQDRCLEISKQQSSSNDWLFESETHEGLLGYRSRCGGHQHVMDSW